MGSYAQPRTAAASEILRPGLRVRLRAAREALGALEAHGAGG